MITTLTAWINKAFNSTIIEAKRHVWVDYLRGIVIILVVYHHAFLGMERNGITVPDIIVDANMAAYSFRMPLFFLLSGIFTALALASKPAKQIIWSKYNLLLYPYLIWSCLQISLQLIFSRYTNSESSFFNYLYILYQPKQIAHFWYLPALFNSTLIFILIKRKLKIKAEHHLLLGVVLFLCAPFVNSISMMSNWMRFYIFLVIGDVVANYILKKEVRDQLKRPIYFIAFIPFFLAAQYNYFYYLGGRSLENESASFSSIKFIPYILKEISFLSISLIGCTSLILFTHLLERWNRGKWLRIIGFHSLYIYIMHVIVVACNRIILTRVFGVENYLVILLAGISLGVVIPVVFYNLFGKKYLWFLFSTKKKTHNEINFKKSTIRTPDVRLTPLQSTANNI